MNNPSRAKKFWSTVHIEEGEPTFGEISADTSAVTSAEADLRAFLWGLRIKATDARVDVLEALSGEQAPISVTALSESIAKKGRPAYDSRSIYRALDVLVDAGLVDRIDLGHDHARYEIAMGRKHHHHVVCMSCGEIEDVIGCDAKALNETASSGLKKFRDVRSHSLEFFSLCKKCEAKSK